MVLIRYLDYVALVLIFLVEKLSSFGTYLEFLAYDFVVRLKGLELKSFSVLFKLIEIYTYPKKKDFFVLFMARKIASLL